MSVFSFFHSKARIFIAAGAACLLLATPALSAEYVRVTKDNANVRTGPGTSNPVYMELFTGYPLKVLQRKGSWVKITDFEGDSGWIYSTLLGKDTTVIINAKKSVNMRSGPSTKDPVIAEVERGVIMVKLDEKGKWTKVKHSSGTVGWIYNPLLWP